jgi:hypothetical protein
LPGQVLLDPFFQLFADVILQSAKSADVGIDLLG